MLFTIPVLIGCNSYSIYEHKQLYVTPDETIKMCRAMGQGTFGMVIAGNMVTVCGENMRASGYIEIEKAGIVGIRFREPLDTDTLVIVFKVVQKSPAGMAGILSGDILLAIDTVKVGKVSEAKSLLLGVYGTQINLVRQRGNQIDTLKLKRVLYNEIYQEYEYDKSQPSEAMYHN
jgi:S1-C subfamily serine protease